MECSCSFSPDSIDDVSISFAAKWVQARNTHKCVECRRDIPAREQYYYEKILCAGGKIETYKTCADCKSIRVNLVGGFYFGEVREFVANCIDDCQGEIPESCISELTPAARAWVCEKIEDQWEDD